MLVLRSIPSRPVRFALEAGSTTCDACGAGPFARAVIEQLVTTFEAKAAPRRLFWRAGELVEGTELRAPPTPRAVLAVAPWQLHAIGIGSRRSRTLREGARRGAALERLRDVDP